MLTFIVGLLFPTSELLCSKVQIQNTNMSAHTGDLDDDTVLLALKENQVKTWLGDNKF